MKEAETNKNKMRIDKIRNLVAFVVLLYSGMWLGGCAMYSYSFDSRTYAIVSKKGNRITRVIILDENSQKKVMFTAIGEGERYFSLENLGRDAYKASLPFKFTPNNKYQFTIMPQGDRTLPDLFLRTDSSGILHN